VRWAGHVARIEAGIEDICRKVRKKKLLGRAKHRCTDNIEKYLREVGWGGTDWIYLIT
jgi:hypothetical protein